MPITDGARVQACGYADGLQPDPELWIDDWSREHAYIPAEGNAEGGKYDLDRTPFAAGVLRALSPASPTRRVVVMGASQLLKTQSMMNFLAAVADMAPGNALVLMPNGTLAERLAMRIDNTIKATPRIRDKFSKPRSRDGKNTNTTKTYRGGIIYIATAGSAANLAEIPARYLVGDEIDDWEADIQGQGDPIEVLENRASTFGRNAKIYYSSSPKRPAAFSKIYALFLRGDQQYCQLPCPHCGHYHALVWENVRHDEAMSRAWMVCPECGAEIDECHKTAMLLAERWVATATSSDGTESFTISQLYAPLGWTSWLDLCRIHCAALEAKAHGDLTKIKAFYNTRLSLCYDDSEDIGTTRELLDRARAEALPARIVPDQGLIITAWFDTQPNRLEGSITAWGPNLESWTLDHVQLWGSPTADIDEPESCWQQLDELRRTPFAHASGQLIRISAYGIDSGGSNTQDVYNYGSARAHMGCVVTKGHSVRNRAIIAGKPTVHDINWRGERVADGVKLWMLGADTAKDWISNRLRLTSGPGAMHWASVLGEDYFEGLLCERPVTRYIKGQPVRDWIKPNGARNEPLDCAVGNLALAHYLQIHKWSAQDWKRLRDNLIPQHATADLFASADAAVLPVAPPEPPPAHLQPRAPSPSAPIEVPAAAAAPARLRPDPAPPAYQPPPPPARRVYSRGI